MVKKLLWLDDSRDPFEDDWLVFSPIGRMNIEVSWVKTFDEFTNWIITNGLPDGICFDHDLSDFQSMKYGYPELMEDVLWPEWEKTGMDCAKWLSEYCMDNELKIPLYNIQSSNEVGKENIDCYLKNHIKHCE